MPSTPDKIPRWLVDVLESTRLNAWIHEDIRAQGMYAIAQAKLLATCGALLSIGTLAIAQGHYRAGSYISTIILIGCAIVSSCGFLLVSRMARPTLAAHCVNLALYVGATFSMYMLGGANSLPARWFAVLPVVAAILGGVRVALFWLGVVLVTYLVMALAPQWGVQFPTPIAAASDLRHQIVTMLFFIVSVNVFFGIGEVMRRWSLELIRRKDEELQKSYEAAVLASQAKTRFLARMSHELRTPLNIIIGYSELLQEEWEDIDTSQGESKELESIVSASQHLLGLISGILDLSKIESGKMSLELTHLPIATLIDELTSHMQPLLGSHDNRFHLDIAQDVLADTLHTDARKLKQILLNLLSNAAKFTREGDITLRLERAAEKGWIFEVSDTGIGLSNEEMTHIWGEFAQADESTTRAYEGTGIGLAIVKRFAEMLGGTISVSSIKGESSCFRLELPTSPPPLDEVALLS